MWYVHIRDVETRDRSKTHSNHIHVYCVPYKNGPRIRNRRKRTRTTDIMGESSFRRDTVLHYIPLNTRIFVNLSTCKAKIGKPKEGIASRFKRKAKKNPNSFRKRKWNVRKKIECSLENRNLQRIFRYELIAVALTRARACSPIYAIHNEIKKKIKIIGRKRESTAGNTQ